MISFYVDKFSDFDFTSNNQYIASSSLDKTVRVWEISKGICIRVIYGVSSQLCIRFHPVSTRYSPSELYLEDNISIINSWTKYSVFGFIFF